MNSRLLFKLLSGESHQAIVRPRGVKNDGVSLLLAPGSTTLASRYVPEAEIQAK